MRVEPLKLLPVSTGTADLNKVDSSSDSNKSFGQFLSEAIDNVNKLQKNSEQASLDLAAGKVQDVSDVMIATEKATVALQLTMQVRNKVLDAYQEVMRMQM